MVNKKIHEELHTRNVKALNNDYVRSNPQAKAQFKAKQAVLRRRRMAIFFILAAIVVAGLVQANRVQNDRLAAKKEQMAIVNIKLEEALETQELLNLQIAKLEDDEYIAKLARKEFFLSEDGEIIFTIPKTTEKKDDDSSDSK